MPNDTSGFALPTKRQAEPARVVDPPYEPNVPAAPVAPAAAPPPPKPATTTTNERLVIYLPPDLDRRLRMHAAANRKSLSEIVAEAIRKVLDAAQAP